MTLGDWSFLFALIGAVSSLLNILKWIWEASKPGRAGKRAMNDAPSGCKAVVSRRQLIILSTLIASSIMFSAVGWYKYAHRTNTQFLSLEITQRISGRTYINEE